LLEVHPSGYYAWQHHPQSKRAMRNEHLLGLIKQFWLESGGVYGYRKIYEDLLEYGEWCGINRVHRLMRLAGLKTQVGYFFHHLIPAIPKQLELAARYAIVEEPNEIDIELENRREEFTIGANWFLFGAGHNNKITVDFSHLTLDDAFANRSINENRFRVQYDISL